MVRVHKCRYDDVITLWSLTVLYIWVQLVRRLLNIDANTKIRPPLGRSVHMMTHEVLTAAWDWILAEIWNVQTWQNMDDFNVCLAMVWPSDRRPSLKIEIRSTRSVRNCNLVCFPLGKIVLALDRLALNSGIRNQRSEDLESISNFNWGIKRSFDFSYISVWSNLTTPTPPRMGVGLYPKVLMLESLDRQLC